MSHVMVPGDGGPKEMMSHVTVPGAWEGEGVTCNGLWKVGVARDKVSHVSNVYDPNAVVFVPGCPFQYTVCAYMRRHATTSRTWSGRHAKTARKFCNTA